MKKTIPIFLILILLSSMVFALQKPLAMLPLTVYEPPIAPGTGTGDECIPWETKNEYCRDDIHHYTQCIKTVSGGRWQLKSERCSDYGENVKCLNGECVRYEDISKAVFYGLGAILIIIILIVLIYLSVRRK